ncbi:hypothetical protein [Thermosyntropha sp.]|uniref:hypothetical protein n=1 Tax=Thermosyntropha sp. TaxID=2740820 RepID=UPI0025EA2CC4|nr:hypothetical protein [Thermosyntropha sp.]MBO8158898.1 hypothetical protein [Thermosyntropha sp.]
MTFWGWLKRNIYYNNNLWILLWCLILVNIMAFLALAGIFSLFLLVIFLILGIAGILFIKSLAYFEEEQDLKEVNNHIIINRLMQEIKPLCEEIFEKEIKAAVEPLSEEICEDFEEDLGQLWATGQDFANEVDKIIGEIDPVLKIVRTTTDERYKLVERLKEDIELIYNITKELRYMREKSSDDLSRVIDNRKNGLKSALNAEKEIFYEYIHKLLLEQLKDYREEQDIAQYFDVYKLADQFTGVLKKSLENRLNIFRDEIAKDLENYSADIVGKMQKYTLKIMNVFDEMEENLNKLVENGKNESVLVLRRLNEEVLQVSFLREKAGEIMLTLSWHDILLERRWQKQKEDLEALKYKVLNEIDEELLEGVKQIIEQEIPGISYFINNPKQALWYKMLLEAELIYQVFKEKKLNDVISDGVYSLLFFVLVLEDLVRQSIRFSEEGLRIKRSLKKAAKDGEHRELFNNIKELLKIDKSELEVYLEDVYPRLFYAFCNNPYVRIIPDNLNLAAWFLFIFMIGGEVKDDEIYLLTGLLLIGHKLRNSYLDPLKSEPLSLKKEYELDFMRYLCYRAVGIIVNKEINGVVSVSFKNM